MIPQFPPRGGDAQRLHRYDCAPEPRDVLIVLSAYVEGLFGTLLEER